MTYQRLPYDDASSTTEMADDCRAVEQALGVPPRRTAGERTLRALARPAPSIRFEDYPQDDARHSRDGSAKGSIPISAAASRLAAFDPYPD